MDFARPIIKRHGKWFVESHDGLVEVYPCAKCGSLIHAPTCAGCAPPDTRYAEAVVEIARLRAALPSEAEREALAKLRELRARLGALEARTILSEEARFFSGLRSVPHFVASDALNALAALLAPEGEVSRG